MEYYQILLITLALLILILILSRLVIKKTGSEIQDKRILRIPMIYRIISLLVFCFSVVASVCILIFRSDDWPYIILWMGFFGLPYSTMFIMWSLWRVEIKGDGFVFRNFFGKKNEYKYSDLEYREHSNGRKWYFYKNNRKVLCIPYYVEGGNILEREYRKNKNKK